MLLFQLAFMHIFYVGVCLLSIHIQHNKSVSYLYSSREVNELRKLQSYLPRASEPRETMVEDRTKCHADHIGQGFDRQTTAAAAILKAIHCGKK